MNLLVGILLANLLSISVFCYAFENWQFVCVCVCGFAGEAGEATEHYQLSLAKNFTLDEDK